MSVSLVIGVLIVVAAAAYVAAPFLVAAERPAPVPSDLGDRPDRARLEAEKAEAYAAIKEAEFDYRMGKLTDTDFQVQRDRYTGQALQAIKALEEATAESRRPAGARAAGRAAASGRVSRIAFCPACGHSVPPRANFCPACGRSLREEEVA
jgi:hypothetical protein